MCCSCALTISQQCTLELEIPHSLWYSNSVEEVTGHKMLPGTDDVLNSNLCAPVDMIDFACNGTSSAGGR